MIPRWTTKLDRFFLQTENEEISRKREVSIPQFSAAGTNNPMRTAGKDFNFAPLVGPKEDIRTLKDFGRALKENESNEVHQQDSWKGFRRCKEGHL